jgi:hypothetical protein
MGNRNVENALYTSRSLYFSGISAIIPNTFTIISPMETEMLKMHYTPVEAYISLVSPL